MNRVSRKPVALTAAYASAPACAIHYFPPTVSPQAHPLDSASSNGLQIFGAAALALLPESDTIPPRGSAAITTFTSATK
jgi:hypothetical protein